MAGAVDLSGLKQRAQAPAAAGEGAAGAAASGATEVTEANFEAEVLVRSGQLPVVVVLWSPRSDASVQLVEILAGAGGRRTTARWALATVNVDTTPRVAQTVRRAGRADRRGAGRRSAAGQLPGRATARSAAAAGSTRCSTPPRASSVDRPRTTRPKRSILRWPPPATISTPATSTPRKTAYEAILAGDPNHAEAKGAVRQIGFLARATARRPDAVAARRRRSDRYRGRLRRGRCATAQPGRRGRVQPADRIGEATAGDDRTTVRTRLIELFELFDPADPDVIAGRRNLANALY